MSHASVDVNMNLMLSLVVPLTWPSNRHDMVVVGCFFSSKCWKAEVPGVNGTQRPFEI